MSKNIGDVRMSEVSTSLVHYGVPGMKWGKRKAKDSSSDSSKAPAKAPERKSRKEVRAINREGRAKFNADRVDKLVAESIKKGDDVLLRVTTPGSTYPTVVTGKEFVSYLSRGGAFDVRTSDIYAAKDKKSGAFVLNDQPVEQYKKVKR